MLEDIKRYVNYLEKPSLILLVGNIASGKSTFRKQCDNDALFINDDDITNLLHGDYKFYDKNLKLLYKTIENNIVTHGLQSGYHVVVDRPCMTRNTRARYIGLAKSLDFPVVCINFKTESPIVHATRRFKSDNRGHSLEYWLKVAQRKYDEYQEPQLEEGINKMLFIDMRNEFLGTNNGN